MAVTLPAEAVRPALAASGGGEAIVHGDSLHVTLPMVHSAIRFTAWALGPLDPVSDLHEPSVAAQASPGHGVAPRFDPDANPRRT